MSESPIGIPLEYEMPPSKKTSRFEGKNFALEIAELLAETTEEDVKNFRESLSDRHKPAFDKHTEIEQKKFVMFDKLQTEDIDYILENIPDDAYIPGFHDVKNKLVVYMMLKNI